MGAGTSLDRSELARLDVVETANLVSAFDDPGIAAYRQACVDFGIDGDMLVRLPLDQLADALRRGGVGSEGHLEFLLEELEKIRSSKIDVRKLDREHLRQFLGRTDSLSSGDWDQPLESSVWSGVSMDSEERVEGLDFTYGDLSGELPATLGMMSHLRYLHASCNQFVGSIPEAIGGLVCLTSLRLDHNKLSGRLPDSLTRLASLTSLNLAWNKMTGTIPTKIGTITALRQLSLGNNKLNGTLPNELGSLHFLRELRLRENKLTGKIPPLLGNMSALTELDLTSNNLQGHIPESLGGLLALRELWLGGNQLVDPLPASLSKLTALESLDLSSNKQLTGKLTDRLFGCLSSLLYLDLSRNFFHGNLPLAAFLPVSFSRELTAPPLSRPRGSDAASGHSTSESRAEESAITHINLSHNRLTGSMPEAIGLLTALDTLDLSHNPLEGEIPYSIVGCVSLRVLSLSQCGLSGNLCSPSADGEAEGGGENGGRGRGLELGRLTALESLRLDGNIFEGPVPTTLGELSRLEILQLEGNCLSGSLPFSLGNLGRLWALMIRDNQLSGKVPPSFERLTSLRTLRLDGNALLQGPIPLRLSSRPGCSIAADAGVSEDTEASMLGARLGDWFLMPREAFMSMSELQGCAYVRPSLVRYVTTIVPYECHVFADARGRRLVIRRAEIAFLSHCWDLSPDQCPPKPSFLEGPFPDTPGRTKLRHMKACIQGAPAGVRYVWLDMFCVPLVDGKRRRAAGRSLPFFIQNSSRFYILVPDAAGLQRYKTRAWCRLEALCAACPHHHNATKSAFAPKSLEAGGSEGFVFDAVACLSSLWEGGARVETLLGGGEGLAETGLLEDPATGNLSDSNDQQDIAEGALRAVNVMERSGRMDTTVAQRWRYSSQKLLYDRQKDCWPSDPAAESCDSSSGTVVGGRNMGRRGKVPFSRTLRKQAGKVVMVSPVRHEQSPTRDHMP